MFANGWLIEDVRISNIRDHNDSLALLGVVLHGVTKGATKMEAEARKDLKEMLGDAATKPLVVRLDGNNVEAGRAILAQANHPLVSVVETMDGAAALAAAKAK